MNLLLQVYHLYQLYPTMPTISPTPVKFTNYVHWFTISPRPKDIVPSNDLELPTPRDAPRRESSTESLGTRAVPSWAPSEQLRTRAQRHQMALHAATKVGTSRHGGCWWFIMVNNDGVLCCSLRVVAVRKRWWPKTRTMTPTSDSQPTWRPWHRRRGWLILYGPNINIHQRTASWPAVFEWKAHGWSWSMVVGQNPTGCSSGSIELALQ